MGKFCSLFPQLFHESSHESSSETHGASSANSLEQRPIFLQSFIKLKKIREHNNFAGTTQNFITHWTAVQQSSHNFLLTSCYCLHICIWLKNCTLILIFYMELKRYSLFNQNLSDFLCIVSTLCHICLIAWDYSAVKLSYNLEYSAEIPIKQVIRSEVCHSLRTQALHLTVMN